MRSAATHWTQRRVGLGHRRSAGGDLYAAGNVDTVFSGRGGRDTRWELDDTKFA